MAQRLPIIDVHAHLAGVGHGDSGCWMSRRKYNSLMYRLLRRSLGLGKIPAGADIDRTYLDRMEADLSAAVEHGAIDAAIIYPHERTYLDDGTPAPAQEMFVPNEYAIACAVRALICREEPLDKLETRPLDKLGTRQANGDVHPNRRGRFLPAMSVHPYRPDALESATRLIDSGAVAMKWLPSSQNIDGADPRCRPIFDLLARRGVPLIAHTGSEHTVKVVRRDLAGPDKLIPALDRGVTVIMAHCATASLPGEKDYSGRFVELARRYPNCYGDTAALAAPGRTRYIRRLLDAGIADKLVHGSDYPVPPLAWQALRRLGVRRTWELSHIWSFFERDVAIKRAMGVPEVVFTNASRLISKSVLDRWGICVEMPGA